MSHPRRGRCPTCSGEALYHPAGDRYESCGRSLTSELLIYKQFLTLAEQTLERVKLAEAGVAQARIWAEKLRSEARMRAQNVAADLAICEKCLNRPAKLEERCHECFNAEIEAKSEERYA